MAKLRTFIQENSDVIWPALCLFFCVLAIIFAALKHINVVEIEDSPGASVNISGNKRVLKINQD
ncbi:MAG: hypothetical protein FWC27_11495 [Firmicutes bacterium]|nr:hypothetical protein [Bacillota bacterium]